MYRNLNYRAYKMTTIPIRRQYIKIELIELTTFSRSGSEAILTNIQSEKIIADVSGQAIGGTISIDANNDLRRSCNLEMIVIDDRLHVGGQNYIWLNKAMRVYVGLRDPETNMIVWYNTGKYLINNPSYNYNSTSKTLSISGMDLMGKLTGVRGGVLEGTEYVIKADSDIKGAIIALLYQAGIDNYIVEENEITKLTPKEIRMPAGSTYVSIIKELSEIESYHEFFFDEDGVFVYQKIPVDDTNVSVINDGFLNGDLETSLLEGEALSYDFENVKNVVEILGKATDVNYFVPKNSVVLGSGNDNAIWVISPDVAYILGDLVKWAPLGESFSVNYIYLKKTTDFGFIIGGTMNSLITEFTKYGELSPTSPVTGILYYDLTTKKYYSYENSYSGTFYYEISEPGIYPYVFIEDSFSNQAAVVAAKTSLVNGKYYYIEDIHGTFEFRAEIVSISDGLSASINSSTFASQFSSSQIADFFYVQGDSTWYYTRSSGAPISINLADYGITITSGTPVSYDRIRVYFCISPMFYEKFLAITTITDTASSDHDICYNQEWSDVLDIYFLTTPELQTKTFRGTGSQLEFSPIPATATNIIVSVSGGIDYSGHYEENYFVRKYESVLNNRSGLALISGYYALPAYRIETITSGVEYVAHGNACGLRLTNDVYAPGSLVKLTDEDDNVCEKGDIVYNYKLRLTVLSTITSPSGITYYSFPYFKISFDDGSYIIPSYEETSYYLIIGRYVPCKKIVFDSGWAPAAPVLVTDADNVIIDYYYPYGQETEEWEINFASISTYSIIFEHGIANMDTFTLKTGTSTVFTVPVSGGNFVSGVKTETVLTEGMEIDIENSTVLLKDAITVADYAALLSIANPYTNMVRKCLDTGAYFWYNDLGWVKDVINFPNWGGLAAGFYFRKYSTHEVAVSDGAGSYTSLGNDYDYKYFYPGDTFIIKYSYATNFLYLPPGETLGFITPDNQSGTVYNTRISINGGEPLYLKNEDNENIDIPAIPDPKKSIYGDYFVFKNKTTMPLNQDSDVVSPYGTLNPTENDFVYTELGFKEWFPDTKITIKTPYLGIIIKNAPETRYPIVASGGGEYLIKQSGEFLYIKYILGNQFEIQAEPFSSAYLDMPISSVDNFNMTTTVASFTINACYRIVMPEIDFTPQIKINEYEPVKIIMVKGGGNGNYIEEPYSLSFANKNYSFTTNDSLYFIGDQQPKSVKADENSESPFNTSLIGELRIVLSGGEYDNITSSQLADQRAKYELWLRTRLNDGFSFETVPILWADVNTKINHPKINCSKPLYINSVETLSDLESLTGVTLGDIYHVISTDLNYVCYSLATDGTVFPSCEDSWRIQENEYIVKSISYPLDKSATMNFSSIKFYEEYMDDRIETPVIAMTGKIISWDIAETLNKTCNIFAVVNGDYNYLTTVSAAIGLYDVTEHLYSLLEKYPTATCIYFTMSVVYDNDFSEEDLTWRPSFYSNMVFLTRFYYWDWYMTSDGTPADYYITDSSVVDTASAWEALTAIVSPDSHYEEYYAVYDGVSLYYTFLSTWIAGASAGASELVFPLTGTDIKLAIGESAEIRYDGSAPSFPVSQWTSGGYIVASIVNNVLTVSEDCPVSCIDNTQKFVTISAVFYDHTETFDLWIMPSVNDYKDEFSQ